jgi:hypothetical protein
MEEDLDGEWNGQRGMDGKGHYIITLPMPSANWPYSIVIFKLKE